MGVCHSEGPRSVSNRLVRMRAYCRVRLGSLSLCPSWHSPWVLAVNQQTMAGVAERTAPLASRNALSFTWAEGRRHGPWPVLGGQPYHPR